MHTVILGIQFFFFLNILENALQIEILLYA
jgi:hypothetical protein